MGLDWELYPVGQNRYKIQNRWTGCFLNISESDGNVIVNQSQETNDETMIWEIIPIEN